MTTNDNGPGRELVLRDLRQEFPQYTIWQEVTPGRARFHAVRARRGIRPYAVVTCSARELRAALREAGPAAAAGQPRDPARAAAPRQFRAARPGGPVL